MNLIFLGDFRYPGSLQLLAKKVIKESKIKNKFTTNQAGFEDTRDSLVD
jgi:hypothetical protein